jgi:virulence factor Mce-like protein
MNRRRSSLAASPLLIGALTTLIVIVAVYLSYNANNGLPFTPTYDLKAELPEAAELTPGNQVRISGSRVGVVSSIIPHQNSATGRVTAIASLKLEKSVEPLPRDTKMIVQSTSSLGLKYLELTKGTSRQTLKAGEKIPVSQAREPVEIQDLFNMFDKKTRLANQKNLNNFGDGLAGRGLGLNDAIATLRPLVKNLTPAMRNLASPKTGLHELFIALDRVASQSAPVAEQQADFYSNLDKFFASFAAAAPSLEQTIVGGVPALRQATHSLPFEASFVNKSTEFMALLRPSARALRTAAAPLGHALAVGATNLSAATSLNTRLAGAAQGFQSFSEDPVVSAGLEDITHTAQVGNPLIGGIAPEQANCNYVTLALRNVASLLSESVGVGTIARALPILGPTGPNGEGLPASAPANGTSREYDANKKQFVDTGHNHVHANPYPNVSGPGQPRVCEAGNEHYVPGAAAIGNVPGVTSSVHDETTRNQDLFGETYSPETQKDFPSTTPPASKGKQK